MLRGADIQLDHVDDPIADVFRQLFAQQRHDHFVAGNDDLVDPLVSDEPGDHIHHFLGVM